MTSEAPVTGISEPDEGASPKRGRRRATQCPECGAKGLRILYGMPDGPIPPAGCTWGGCIVTGHDPKYACSECDAEWGSLKGAGML